MAEQEIKLHVPAGARAAVEKDIRQRGAAERIALRALYFDTPARELARARVAIRLRQEGRDWVQTLKMPGENAISKIELNHARPGPVLDLSLYAGTAAEPALAAMEGELEVRYETDVTRLLRKVRTRGGVVEIAFDTGCVKAGGLELPISEIEFELVSGKLSAVFELSRRWQQRHGLVLDARSKSERGDALARAAQDIARAGEPGTADADRARAERIASFWAPRHAEPARLSPAMSPAAALDAVTAECLDQIMRNANTLAEADTAGVYEAGTPEHLHQLRVGIRRLRSAWRLFDGLTPLPPRPLRDAVRVHFAAMGANRDADVMRDTLAPALYAAGMPKAALPETGAGDTDAGNGSTRALAASRAFQGWMLDLQAWHLSADRDAQTDEDAKAASGSPDVAGDTAGSPADASQAAADAGAQDDESSPQPIIIPLTGGDGPAPGAGEPILPALLTQRLRKWHKRVQRDGQRFGKLSVEARHDLRKRAKTLRYGLAFAESLLPARRLRDYGKALAKVQAVLGDFNDLAVAQAYFGELTAARPQAWFALGWLAAQMQALPAKAEKVFDELGKAATPWK